MSPYTKAATFLIRLVGFGCIAVALVLLAGDSFQALLTRTHAQQPIKPVILGLDVGLLCIGVVLMWKSSGIARRFTQDLEDENGDEGEGGLE